MKHLLLFFALIFSLSFKSYAYTPEYDDSQYIAYKISVPAATNSTSTILVDLSDTVNFPHKRTRELFLTSVSVKIDKVAASTCTVKLGVLNFVNASTGSVTWFNAIPSERNVSNSIIDLYFTGNYYYNLLVKKNSTENTDGLTPHILSNDKTSGSTTYQNDVNLLTSAGNAVPPALGDLILSITKDSSNIVDVYIELSYFAQ